jgi:hypothetical protein
LSGARIVFAPTLVMAGSCGRIGYQPVLAGDAGTLDRDGLGGVMKVQYNPAMPDRATDDWVRPHLNIVNGTSQDVPLAELTVRYWYTEEAPATQSLACDFAVIGCDNLAATFSPVTPPRTGADEVVELSFLPAAGTLVGGGETQEMQLRIGKSDFSAYDETDDYSYDGSLTDLTDDTRITLYRNGVLIWGTEPS